MPSGVSDCAGSASVSGDLIRPTGADLAEAVHAARAAVMEFGRAEVGDKTLVDVLVPFDETLTEAVGSGASFVEAWQQATAAAAQAAEATKDLLPRMGRARPHAERSLGTPDAGAVSLSLIVDAIGKVLTEEPAGKVSSR